MREAGILLSAISSTQIAHRQASITNSFLPYHRMVLGPQELGRFPLRTMRSLGLQHLAVTCIRGARARMLLRKSFARRQLQDAHSHCLFHFGSLSMLFLWFRSTFDACTFAFEASNRVNGLMARPEQQGIHGLFPWGAMGFARRRRCPL